MEEVQTQSTEPMQPTVEHESEVQTEEASQEVLPAETTTEVQAEQSEPTPSTETLQPQTGICDSCGKEAELIDTPHHQEGNDHVWHYCAACKLAHDKEVYVLANLKELMKTHPADADNPEVAGMFRQGKTLDEVKKHLDTTRQPSLEAEVQQ